MKSDIDHGRADDHFEMILDGIASNRRFEDLIVAVPAEKRADVAASWDIHQRHVAMLRRPRSRPTISPTIAGPDYRISEEIGVGGMGTVFAARRTSDLAPVAVKLLHAHLAASVRWRVRFRREFEALKKLDHPHIVKVYDWIESDGVSGFAMQKILGRSLAKCLPLAPEKILRIGWEVAEALHHAHGCGVLHRDIKPQNILIDYAGHAYIGDFGLARITDESSLTPIGDVLASLSYASPEQVLAGRATIDARTDVYSLGATLFEALTGEPPYGSKPPAELVAAIAYGEVPDPTTKNPELPRGIGDIVQRALAKNPDDRYPSARALADDLELMMRGQSPEATRRTPRERRIRRRTMGAAAIVLLCLFLVPTLFRPELSPNSKDGAPPSTARFGFESRDLDRGPTAQGMITFAQPVISGELRIAAVDEFTDEISRCIVCPTPATSILGARAELPVSLPPGRYRSYLVRRDGEIDAEYDFDVIDAEAAFRVDIPERMRDIEHPLARIDAGTVDIEHHSFSDKSARKATCIVPPFLIDKLLVMNRDYLEFCRRTRRPTPDHWKSEPGFAANAPSNEWLDLPLTKISYDEARDYAAWRGMRLPTLAEWLWAARGIEQRLFPWGNEADDFWARVPIVRGATVGNDRGDYESYRRHVRSAAIDPFPHPKGLLNLFGNVWQWTSSPPATTESDGRWRALRDQRYTTGFAWNSGDQMPNFLGLEGRAFSPRQAHDLTNGFRCARSATLPEASPAAILR